jgi:hypothetical protein
MVWLRMEGGCGLSSCGGVVWCLMSVGILTREGVTCTKSIAGLGDVGATCSSTGECLDEDTRRGGDILLVDCLDDSRLVRLGLGNGVLMNNCSHIEGLNIPAIGFTLAISCLKPLSVISVVTSNADIATCHAASNR